SLRQGRSGAHRQRTRQNQTHRQVTFHLYLSSSLPSRGELVTATISCLAHQPHCLRQTIITHQQVHLDPFRGAFLVHREAQGHQRSALHAHSQNGGLVGFGTQASRQ